MTGALGIMFDMSLERSFYSCQRCNPTIDIVFDFDFTIGFRKHSRIPTCTLLSVISWLIKQQLTSSQQMDF